MITILGSVLQWQCCIYLKLVDKLFEVVWVSARSSMNRFEARLLMRVIAPCLSQSSGSLNQFLNLLLFRKFRVNVLKILFSGLLNFLLAKYQQILIKTRPLYFTINYSIFHAFTIEPLRNRALHFSVHLHTLSWQPCIWLCSRQKHCNLQNKKKLQDLTIMYIINTAFQCTSSNQALAISINYSWSILGRSLWNFPLFWWVFSQKCCFEKI